MSTTSPSSDFERVCTVDAVREDGPLIVSPNGQSIGLFYHEDTVHAVDNRCPHMGFPLTKGSVEDGILTCHWHHARFELSCGDTFDPFADDVQTYPVQIHDGDVYVEPDPEPDVPPEEHWRERLQHGLRENLSLVIAKSVIGFEDVGVPATEAIRIGTDFGTAYRENGWGRGLTTLGVMANLLPHLRQEDRRRALYIGLGEVASECSGEPPFFVQDPLAVQNVPDDRLIGWFRENIEVRDADGAERVLRAAIQTDSVTNETILTMLVGAVTDHRYLDSGHRLDFINKAVETLDTIGWEHADDVLPSLVPSLASASRAEETSAWRQPIDVAALCEEAFESIPSLVDPESDPAWSPPPGMLETLIGDDPEAIIHSLLSSIEAGASAESLASLVTDAAAKRIAQFGTANEFNDWNTVHHTYTFANGVCGLASRTRAWEAYRGVFDAAIKVYLDRFLNMPPTPVPDGDGSRNPDETLAALRETFEIEADEEVDRAGQLTASYLAGPGEVARLKRALGQALLREDVGFHTRQNLEAAINQYDRTESDRQDLHLIATARYLSAHTPTRRSGEQTFRIAERLNRGERLHEAAE